MESITSPLNYIATEIPPELIQLHERLEEQTRQLEAKANRLASKASLESKTKQKRGRKPRTLFNPLAGFLSYYRFHSSTELYNGYPLWIDDVLQGISRLDWYRPDERSIPLSVKALLRILDALPVINTNSIAALLLVEERQARRYLKATELAMPFLLKGVPDNLKSFLQGEANDDEGWPTELDDHLTEQHQEAA